MKRIHAIHRILSLGAPLALTALAAPLQAMPQEPPAQDEEAQPESVPPPRRTLQLSLDDCIDLAIRYNNGLSAEWLSRRIAEVNIDAAEGVFDPVFTTEVSWADNERPTGSALGGAAVIENTNTLWNTGLNGLLPSGLTYDLSWSVDRVDTNNSFLLFNPQTRNFLDLRVTQPLLRGAWTTIGRSDILGAEIDKEIADENFYSQLLTLVNLTTRGYWNLYFGYRNVEVQRENLELGEELLRITKSRYEEGLVPSSDILTVSADVKRRYQLLIQSQNDMLNAEDELKRLVFPIASRAEWDFQILPMQSPRQVEEEDIPGMEEALAEAFRNRPELRASRLQVKNRELDVTVNENSLLPQLDFVGTVRSETLGIELGDIWTDTFAGENTSYSVGLNLSLPLGNRVARANTRSAQLQLQRSIELLREQENTVAIEVRASLRQIYYLKEQWDAATQTRRSTEEDHRARRVKLGLGLITQFDFQTVEEDLTRARTDEILAQTEYEKALADLDLALGRIWKNDTVQKILKSERFRRR